MTIEESVVSGRVAVLLGAGASRDAGLPLTFELAELVLRQFNVAAQGVRAPSWVRALNFVYGSMVGHQARDGDDPLRSVDIERLISALRLLAEASDNELAPFVAQWKPGALGLTPGTLDPSLGRSMTRAIEKVVGGNAFFAERDVVDAVASISRAATEGSDGRVYVEVESHVLSALVDLLSTTKSVEYLRPLANLARAQPGGLDVITLNYDLTVETMANQQGLEVNRGVDRWSPGVPLLSERRDQTLNLYKLHGSLDWVFQADRGRQAPAAIRVASLDDDVAPRILTPPRRSGKPYIVVGQREKLSAEGPMLPLMRAAEDALRAASHLLVVGYSFGDAHINALMRDWMSADSTRTLGVLDVSWASVYSYRDDDFRGYLLRQYGSGAEEGVEPRFVPIQGTAAGMLEQALEARPEPLAASALAAHAQRRQSIVQIDLTLSGPAILGAVVTLDTFWDASATTAETDVWLNGHSTAKVWLSAEEISTEGDGVGYQPVATTPIGDWGRGQSISLYVAASPRPLHTVRVSVWGRRLDSANGRTEVSVELAGDAFRTTP